MTIKLDEKMIDLDAALRTKRDIPVQGTEADTSTLALDLIRLAEKGTSPVPTVTANRSEDERAAMANGVHFHVSPNGYPLAEVRSWFPADPLAPARGKERTAAPAPRGAADRVTDFLGSLAVEPAAESEDAE